MRILIAYTSTLGENPFVPTLKKALEQCGAIVEWGLEKFWEGNKSYDIVFFQWPEAIWNFSSVDKTQVELLKERIAYWKSKGSKIAYTRHNTMSHTDKSPAMMALYRLIETSCDVMFHMGEYSRKEYVNMHGCASKQRHVVVPHHISETVCRKIEKAEARAHLKLPTGSRVVLCFGSFRNNEERYFFLEGFRRLKLKGKLLLAPSLFPGRVFRRNPFGVVANVLKRLPFLLRFGRFGSILKSSRVSDEDLPYYFAAADVVLIQRRNILNSGNLPMGFYFGRVVVGPDVGNVGEILRETGNPTFNPTNVNSLTTAILEAFSEGCTSLGASNRSYADSNWNSNLIGTKIFRTFQNVLKPSP